MNFYLKSSLLFIFTINIFFKLESKTNVFEYTKKIQTNINFTGLNNVDAIYVINLDNRPNKWSYVKSQFSYYDIKPTRMSAIDGFKLNEDVKKVLAGPYQVRLRGGQTGCLLSHLSCLRDALERDFDVIWICEDDIKILGNPHKLSNYLIDLNLFDNEWDVLYTDIDSKGPNGSVIRSLSSDFRPDMEEIPLEDRVNRIKCFQDIMKIRQRFGNYSYLISKNGIKKILDYFEQNFLWTAYDIDIHYIPKIREYSLTYDLVTVDWKLPSDNISQ